MEKNQLRALFLCAALALFGTAIASAETPATPTVVAQATPAPKPTQNPFTFSGYDRAFYFTRYNQPELTTKNKLNQATFNNAIDLHGAYDFGGGFSVGATYLYANPLTSNCDTAAEHAAGCTASNKGLFMEPTIPDDTLPGFQMNTLYEAYLQYKDPTLFVRLGDQVINTPWANGSDSRLKPAAFEGGDASFKFNSNWTGDVMYMDRFEDRVDSAFLNSTLLTATKIADAPGAAGNLHVPNYSAITTNGFAYGHLGYSDGPFVANGYYYAFNNIANAAWFDGKYTWKTFAKPFVAAQGGTESNAGSAVIGKIDSQVFGIQAGISPVKNVDFTVGYDDIPEKSTSMTLPANVTCSSSGQIGGSAVFPYFLPAGGTPQCHNNGDGTTTVYYGGWASPYTDSYATDQMYDTSISQGQVDRRSGGQGLKVALVVNLDDKHFRFITSRAWYDYGNATAGVAPTGEFDADATYFFSKPGKGAYHGFSLRHRYAERTQQFFTTNPDFKYNRTQLEYDF